jgi:Undecaprenyl-phosphate galactose phosphotransferase WbaP
VTAPLIADKPDSSAVFSSGKNQFSGHERLWDSAETIACWSYGRDFQYVLQVWKTSLPVWFADMIAVGISVVISAIIFRMSGGAASSPNWIHVACWCLALSISCALSGLYPAIGMNSVTELRLLSRVIAMGVTLCMAYDIIHGGDNQYLMLWPLYGLMMAVLVPLARALVRQMICRYSWWGLQTIVIGAGESGREILRRLNRNPSLGFNPVAMVDKFRPDWITNDEGFPVAGINSLQETPELSARHHAYCGIFAGSTFPPEERMQMIDALTSVFPQLYITAESADAGRQWSGFLELGNVRLLRVTERLLMPGGRWIKRGIDLVVVLLLAPIILPLVFCLAMAVKLTSPGPAFYCHKRIGRNGRTIRVWKMRSMVMNADTLLKQYLIDHPDLRSDWERLHKLPDDPRVTKIGRFLRKTSLDEIPQLWNVFLGEMSLVGPRPIVQAEITKYQNVYPLYLRVTPGITGLWQINGRNSTTYEERIGYDAEYVRNWSVFLDLYILAKTVRTVVTCDGAC